jgi:2-polyprenyl-3-methyl-5-hydroxy-6-metoxy-1,4-benzoquinol methylase
MNKEYYTTFYSKEVDLDLENFYYSNPSESWFWYQRKKIILNYFKKLEKDKELNILDVGSGKGRSLFEINKKSSFKHNYYGIEVIKMISDYPNEYIKRKGMKNFHFLTMDVSKEGWSKKLGKKFDLIIFSEVIEHLFPEDQKKVLEEIKTLLSPMGILIITCPNKNCLIKKGIKLFQRIPLTKKYLKKLGDFNGSNGHVAEPSFLGLKELTKEFKEIEHGGFTFSYGNEILDNNAFYFLVFIILNSFFKKFLPSFCFDQYIILKKK